MAGNFAARIAQKNLATKHDIADFVKEKNFDDKLKKLNKKVSSNKTRHAETDLTKRVGQIQKTVYDFLLVECILQAMMVNRNFKFLPQCLVH